MKKTRAEKTKPEKENLGTTQGNKRNKEGMKVRHQGKEKHVWKGSHIIGKESPPLGLNEVEVQNYKESSWLVTGLDCYR